MKLEPTQVDTEYIKLIGGLDQESPAITVPPGSLASCLNYEPGTDGGYRRIDGYERFSGQPAPSAATYYNCHVTLVGSVAVGNTITGVTSAATGVVCNIISATEFNITKVTGTFVVENFSISAVTVGTFTTSPLLSGATTGDKHVIALAAAADIYRADISAPVGSGALRGLGSLNGVIYAFRDNVLGTAKTIYKSTASGWSAITLHSQISFNTGVGEIFEGNTITQVGTGATALVLRVVKQSGSWTSDAAGRLIISTITGTFNATGALQVSSVTKATATSLVTAITIAPGGRYQIKKYNFSGNVDKLSLYGCDGVNLGFELRDDIYVPIVTGMATDVPEKVGMFKQQLFFSFKSSIQNSSPGAPYTWSVITGTAQIALGDTVTGFEVLTGKALAIFSRNSSSQLLGNNIDDFTLDSLSDEVGCLPYTTEKIGYVYCLDDRGIVQVNQTDSYGNFELGTVSRIVQPLINTIRSKVVASAVYRSRNQYRLYANDGSGVIMTIMSDGTQTFTNFTYPDNVFVTLSDEDANGKDVVYFGSDQGMVYQADKGSSFDGDDIESFARFPFHNLSSPTILKTFRKVTIEMNNISYSSLKFFPDFSYGDSSRPRHAEEDILSFSTGGYWDINSWENFYWDAAVVNSPSIRINGTGINIQLLVYSKNNYDLGHKIDGIIYHYTPRRFLR